MIRGEIYSHTTVFDADYVPEGFECPYTIALIRVLEGEMKGKLITAQLTDFDTEKRPGVRTIKLPGKSWSKPEYENIPVEEYWPEVEIGMEVEMVTRKLSVAGDPEKGMIIYGYKFRPKLSYGE